MRISTLFLCLLAAAAPLRAQHLFVVVENGAHKPVRAVRNGHPQVESNGELHTAQGITYSISKAVIYGRGLINVSAFKLEGTSAYSDAGQPQLHIYGRLKSDRTIKNCFFVVTLVSDTGSGVIYEELPDLEADREVVYDQLFDLPIHNLFTTGHFTYYLFSNGLELLTTDMPPLYVHEQRQRTEDYMEKGRRH